MCTWTAEHPRLVAAAVARGLAVFCEEPLATDLAAARALTDGVVAAGVANQVGLILRRSPANLLAHDLISDPRAGEVMTVTFRDDQFIPTQGHDGIEDVVSAHLRFAGGATGTLTSVWHDNLARSSLRRVEIFCRNRWIALDGDDWFGPVTWTDSDGSTTSPGGEALVVEAERIAHAAPAGLGGLNPDVAFVTAVAEGRPAFPDVTVALAAHEVVDALYRRAGRRCSGASRCSLTPGAARSGGGEAQHQRGHGHEHEHGRRRQFLVLGPDVEHEGADEAEVDSDDRRARIIRTTAKGRRAQLHFEQRAAEVTQMVHELDPTERAALRGLFDGAPEHG